MATHEIYLGGPPTANYSRAMFPAPPFSASGSAFVAMKPAAHKGPATFNLQRTLDANPLSPTGGGTDSAFAEFLRNNTIAQADVLGVQVIPRRVIFEGLFYEVESAVGAATTVTPALRGVAGATFPVIDLNVAGSKGFAKAGATAWQAASGSIMDATDGTDFFIVDPTMLDLALTTLDATTKLGKLKLHIVPLVRTVEAGSP